MIRKVLVVQPFGIGDMLFITPVLRALRLIPTVERVDILIGSRTRSVIQANPHVDDIYVIDKDKMHANSLRENFQLMKELHANLKKNSYDLLLDYSIRGEYAFLSHFFLGIPLRAGYAYKNRGFFHNVRLSIPDGFQNKHVVDFACDLAEKAGVSVSHRFIEFFFSENQTKTLDAVLSPQLPSQFIALSLGGGESWGKDAHLKRWPVERFVALSKYLLKKTGLPKIALVGSAGEQTLAAEFLQSDVSAEDWTGKLSIVETAWVIKKSNLFLGNDGGLLHLARAVFKPVIGIYGPADPAVYGPYESAKQSTTPGFKSTVIYRAPVNGKPRYFKFRYDKNDQSILDVSVEDAIYAIEAAQG